jgi:amino acid transporter
VEKNGVSMSDGQKLGPTRVWALAAGGMVGGGIYIALGVVVEASGAWAWLAFLIAGLVAVASANSYARLANHFRRSGGAFEFLEEMHREGLAGNLSWLLILGYTLTISVYVFAFGHYLANGFGGGAMLVRGLGIGGGIALVALNLCGLGRMTLVEVVIVTANLLALLALAGFGLAQWDPARLSEGIEPRGVSSTLVGAAAIFVSYEGFQLLAYEYDSIRAPERTFRPVLLSAAGFVVVTYVLVALGATMLAGAGAVIENGEVALAVAARQGAGFPGFVVLTIAAAFATSAAINSTLFSTARLAARVARDRELPPWLDHENSAGVPDRPIVVIGALAITLAMLGSLSTLVEAASLVFLLTFLIVNALCWRVCGDRWLPGIGIAVGTPIGIVLIVRLVTRAPGALAIIVVITVAICFLRPWLLRRRAQARERDPGAAGENA